jgi:hemoglobin-like flavoprotein
VTPEQVALVQSSFAELGPGATDLGRRFYKRLFEVAPSVQAMISEDPAVQASLFVSELAVIVDAISRFDAFVARASRLGARHARYGVTHVHYETAGQVLADVLAETLGPAFTGEVQDAWRLAFDLVAETMMQGAAAADADPATGRPEHPPSRWD